MSRKRLLADLGCTPDDYTGLSKVQIRIKSDIRKHESMFKATSLKPEKAANGRRKEVSFGKAKSEPLNQGTLPDKLEVDDGNLE